MNSEHNAVTKIREAKACDYDACLPLLTSLYHADIGSDFQRTFESFVNGEDSVVLLAENSRKAVGVLIGSYNLDIDWEGKVGRIQALFVDETFRRTGVGRKLLDRFTAEAKEHRCRAIRSRVNIENRAARSFHKSLGFWKANTYEYILELQEQGKR